MSYYSSGLANLIKRLSWTGFIDSFILFNRYYNPDINIDKIEIVPSNVLSNPEDISVSLRWIALLSRIIETDLVPSTGIHDANGVIKQILAGAGSVQIVSTLYKNGAEYINNIIQELSEWMKSHEFASIDDFKGKIHDLMPENNMFERVQYMKYYGGIS
jgi:dihydroorotate dehydrogenase (fumarate)